MNALDVWLHRQRLGYSGDKSDPAKDKNLTTSFLADGKAEVTGAGGANGGLRRLLAGSIFFSVIAQAGASTSSTRRFSGPETVVYFTSTRDYCSRSLQPAGALPLLRLHPLDTGRMRPAHVIFAG